MHYKSKWFDFLCFCFLRRWGEWSNRQPSLKVAKPDAAYYLSVSAAGRREVSDVRLGDSREAIEKQEARNLT